MTLSISSPTLATGNRSIFFLVASFSIGFTSANTELKNDGAFRIIICEYSSRARRKGPKVEAHQYLKLLFYDTASVSEVEESPGSDVLYH